MYSMQANPATVDIVDAIFITMSNAKRAVSQRSTSGILYARACKLDAKCTKDKCCSLYLSKMSALGALTCWIVNGNASTTLIILLPVAGLANYFWFFPVWLDPLPLFSVGAQTLEIAFL